MHCARCLAVLAAWLVAASNAPAQTGTFIDRHVSTDVRVASYNVEFDTNFPDTDPARAAKFARVVYAIDADILNLQEIYNHSAADVVALMNSIMPLGADRTWYAYRGSDNVIVSKFPLSMESSAMVPAGDRNLAMALVDLPDDQYDRDFYIMNNHYKCCGGYDYRRQKQSDALVSWMRDGRTPGENIDLPAGTPMAVVGDLNLVDSLDPLNTLLNGDIADEAVYGADSPPDWDGTCNTDVHPLHNATGSDDYTWRNDNSDYDPGRLDYIIYTDSMLMMANKFVLNTTTMTAGELAATGLQEFDVAADNEGRDFDHLPLVADFRMAPEPAFSLVLAVAVIVLAVLGCPCRIMR